MTQSFDEWWENNYMNLSADRTEAEDIYNLGAQSRQAEVDSLEKGWVERKNERDELQKRIDELKAQLILQGQRFNDQSQKVSDLEFNEKSLQKRIDKAMIQISNHYHSCVARKNLKRFSASVSEIAEIEVHESSMCVLENILKGKEND